jgi:hypothetical protein
MITFFKRLFAAPSARELAIRELEEARRQLLHYQSAKVYAEKMTEFYSVRISQIEEEFTK